MRGLRPLDLCKKFAGTAYLISLAQVTPTDRRRVVDNGWARQLARYALDKGGRIVAMTHVHWDVSGQCENPTSLWLEGRPEGRPDWGLGSPGRQRHYVFAADGFDRETPITVHMEVRCRRCSKCLKQRQMLWQYRAKAEIAAAPRTWFGTMTLSPEHHWHVQQRATLRLSRGGTVFERLSSTEQFLERHKEISADVTKYIKRLRKESGASLRYLLVVEAHKNGLPHYHMLIHEVAGSEAVRHATLRGQWPHGHSLWRLVSDDPKAAGYVCKYLSKAALARVRASCHYGKTT